MLKLAVWLATLLLLPGLAKTQNISADYQTIKPIYDRLVLAFGETRQAPKLEILSIAGNSRTIASYIPNPTPIIRIDQTVIDLCRTFGRDSANALAIVLSHELAHYYRQHEFCSEFAFAMRGTNLSQQLKLASKDQKLVNESQADNVGLFVLQVAGFQSGGLHERLIDAIYKKYALPDNVSGYPSRQERKLIAQKAEREINTLYPVFLTANFSLLRGDYETASQCYTLLLQKFPSRELLNNAGVCQLHYALYKTDKYEMPFALPVELDGQSRLQIATTRSGWNQDDVVAKQALAEARRYFEEAIRKDPAYTPAYINLACCHLLAQNYEAAIGRLNERMNQADVPASAYLVRAIGYHLNQQPEKAKRDVDRVTEINSSIQYNKELILSGNALHEDKADLADWMDAYWKKYPLPVSKTNPIIEPKWLPDAQTTSTPNALIISPSVKMESWQKGTDWLVRLINDHHKTVFVYRSVTVDNPYRDIETIRTIFGQAIHSVKSVNGEYWVYPQVIFWINEGRAKAWYVYTKP